MRKDVACCFSPAVVNLVVHKCCLTFSAVVNTFCVGLGSLCSRAPWLTFHLRCRVRHARSSLGVAQNPDVAECGFWRRNISTKMDASQTLLSRRSLTALAEVVIKAESPSIAWSLLLAAVPLVERRLLQNLFAPFPWPSPLHGVNRGW